MPSRAESDALLARAPNQVKRRFIAARTNRIDVFDPPACPSAMHLLRRRPRSTEAEFDDDNAALDAFYWYRDACVLN